MSQCLWTSLTRWLGSTLSLQEKNDDETKFGIVLGALSRSSIPKHHELAEHLIVNSHRFASCASLKIELREILGTRKYMSRDATELNAVAKGKSKDKGGKGSPTPANAKGKGKGQIPIKFADLNDAAQVKKAFELQETLRPYLLVGSTDRSAKL
eukprot:5176555-Amphidinium_carterae.2